MRKSRPSFAPVITPSLSGNNHLTAPWLRWLMRGLAAMVVIYLGWLAVVIGLRATFPWDLFVWAESPFMTNMLKLDLGQPLFGPPADGNSFVYSPGLEYLTFALLKPLGLHLDIRFCRLVNVAIGVLAGGLTGCALGRIVKVVAPENSFPRIAWLGGGVAVLVIFKNFTADVTHPDNLVMFHTVAVFLLTFWAWRDKNFGVALAVMVLAGCGVFAKQILLLAFLGPALVFARFNPWGWRKWFGLLLVGGCSTAAALWSITRSPDARFYLLELLPRQGVHVTRLYGMAMDLTTGDRAFLLMLGFMAVGLLWRAGAVGRDYLHFWLALGFFSVFPNLLSYVKTMGAWNNLIILQLWFLFALWPALALWLARPVRRRADNSVDAGLFNWTFALALVAFVGLLLPPKKPAHPALVAACREIQRQVDADVKAGRKILVGHGMMYLLHAGAKDVPRDRVNSILELKAGRYASRSHFPERLRQHYYDRLYLTLEDWYPPEFISEINRHYAVQSVVKPPAHSSSMESARFPALIAECRILIPRTVAIGVDAGKQ